MCEDEEVVEGMILIVKYICMNDILGNVDYFDKDKEYIFICCLGCCSENVCYYF